MPAELHKRLLVPQQTGAKVQAVALRLLNQQLGERKLATREGALRGSHLTRACLQAVEEGRVAQAKVKAALAQHRGEDVLRVVDLDQPHLPVQPVARDRLDCVFERAWADLGGVNGQALRSGRKQKRIDGDGAGADVDALEVLQGAQAEHPVDIVHPARNGRDQVSLRQAGSVVVLTAEDAGQNISLFHTHAQRTPGHIRTAPMTRRSSPTRRPAAAQASSPAKRPSAATADDDDPGHRPYKSADYFARAAPKHKKWRTAKQILADPQSIEYAAASAPPSVKPPRARYCDVTGLAGKYVDPRSGLRYHSAPVYQLIKSLGPNAVQAYLQLRNAGVFL